MGKSYEIGKMNESNMECVNKAYKILIDTTSTVKTQPLYDTAVINVQNNAQTSSNIFFLTVSMCTYPPLPPSELNKETRLRGPTHAAALDTFKGMQLTWTRLAQEFVDSPAVFSATVKRVLNTVTNLPSTVCVLNYTDDISISAETEANCLQA